MKSSQIVRTTLLRWTISIEKSLFKDWNRQIFLFSISRKFFELIRNLARTLPSIVMDTGGDGREKIWCQLKEIKACMASCYQIFLTHYEILKYIQHSCSSVENASFRNNWGWFENTKLYLRKRDTISISNFCFS